MSDYPYTEVDLFKTMAGGARFTNTLTGPATDAQGKAAALKSRADAVTTEAQGPMPPPNAAEVISKCAAVVAAAELLESEMPKLAEYGAEATKQLLTRMAVISAGLDVAKRAEVAAPGSLPQGFELLSTVGAAKLAELTAAIDALQSLMAAGVASWDADHLAEMDPHLAVVTARPPELANQRQAEVTLLEECQQLLMDWAGALNLLDFRNDPEKASVLAATAAPALNEQLQLS